MEEDKKFKDLFNDVNRKLMKDGGKSLEDLPIHIDEPSRDKLERDFDADR